jgi:hypothetical protein
MACTWVFVYDFCKEFVAEKVRQTNENYELQLSQQPPFDQAKHDELVKQGKTKEAEEMANEGDHKAEHWIAVGNRIQFCEENVSALSIIPTGIIYVIAYFLFWILGCLCVQYVKKGAG